MKITAIKQQVKASNRASIYIDGAYSFSLDVYQLLGLGLKVGQEITQAEVDGLIEESQFGKLYARALEYCLSRPHSTKEIKDYLYKKTLTRRIKTKDGRIAERPGVSPLMTNRVFEHLAEKGYINDEAFARWWVDGRKFKAGISQRKLTQELASKGVDRQIIDDCLKSSTRNDHSEIRKVIAKKASKYTDRDKLVAYLARQGFSYDDIKSGLAED